MAQLPEKPTSNVLQSDWESVSNVLPPHSQLVKVRGVAVINDSLLNIANIIMLCHRPGGMSRVSIAKTLSTFAGVSIPYLL